MTKRCQKKVQTGRSDCQTALVDVVVDWVLLNTLKVKELKDQLEIHRRRDQLVPIKSCLKNKAAKLEALLQALDRYEKIVSNAVLPSEEEALDSERHEAHVDEDDGEDML
jgi:hypothetical protein